MLRTLTPSQQIMLLFAVLFGLLVAASAWLFARQLRLRADDERAWQTLAHGKRLLGSSWAMVSVFWVSWALGDGTAIVLFAFVSFLILRQFVSLVRTQRGDHRALALAFFVVLPLQYALVALRQTGLFTVFIPVYVFLALPTLSALGDEPQRFLQRNAQLQWGVMVCVYGMSHVPALLLVRDPALGQPALLVFFLVAVVQTSQLVQHVAAWRWPGPPLAPHISRSFQWRAWMIGLAAGALTGALLSFVTPLSVGRALAMGFIASLAGTLGHFVMKAIKRDHGIASWGLARQSVVGGGNGLLDRVDGLCFAAPVFFHALQWVRPAH